MSKTNNGVLTIAKKKGTWKISKTTDHLDSYEEAVETALKYSLENLI